MMVKSSMKSSRCIGSSLASAARRPPVSSAMIISRTAVMRPASKNMCSVRLSPMPSAPNLRAVRASSGVSALARTFIVRSASAQPISVAKSPDSSGWMVATFPTMISPVEPLRVSVSPALATMSRAASVPDL